MNATFDLAIQLLCYWLEKVPHYWVRKHHREKSQQSGASTLMSWHCLLREYLFYYSLQDFGTGVKENLFLNNYFEEVYSQNGKNSLWCSTWSYTGSPSSHFIKYVDKLTDLALNTGHNTREKKTSISFRYSRCLLDEKVNHLGKLKWVFCCCLLTE